MAWGGGGGVGRRQERGHEEDAGKVTTAEATGGQRVKSGKSGQSVGGSGYGNSGS